MRTEKEIKEGLKKIEEIYFREFGIENTKDNPLNIDLTATTVALAIEKIVRATEICTIRWILEEGGGLNVEKWKFKKVKKKIKSLKTKS